MRTFYLLRVILVSMEALVLVSSLLTLLYFERDVKSLATSLSLNDEISKYLMLLPIALAAWSINEARLLLQEDKETIRILTKWEDYWKLKTHIWVSLGYAVVFALMSLFPWVTSWGIGTGTGFVLFVASIIGQLSLAISIYAARIRVREIISHVTTL